MSETENIGKLDPENYSGKTMTMLNRLNHHKINYDLIESIIQYICHHNHEKRGCILVFLPGLTEIRRLHNALFTASWIGRDKSRYRIYPLHSALSSSEQSSVFDIPPDGVWKIVIATNIAETGITIPDVVYVIDSGKVKEIGYDHQRSISTLREVFVSQSSALQRRGRAGRVQPGQCFHLFTRHRFESELQKFQVPEILRTPLENTCLKIKMIQELTIAEFFKLMITVPSENMINRSLERLREVCIKLLFL